MRILHVIAGARNGGAETFAQDAITALAAEGVEQRAVARPHPLALQRLSDAGVPVTPLAFSPQSRFLSAPRMIRRLAETWQADLVHAWMSRAASFIPGGGIHGRMPCPVIGWLGGYYSLDYFRNADCLVGVTPDICRRLVSAGAPAHRTFVCRTFGTLPEAPAIDRASLDTPPQALVLLVLSRMHRKKGIDTAIDALSHLPGAYLWLAGDGPEIAEYQALARRRGLMDRIRFLGWRTDRKALLEACDICLLPSRYEPFGTVIAEAWSMRRPLIATPADGARQFVRDGENGLLFPIEDGAALAECVSRVASDPGLARRMTEAGYRDYERLFSRPVVIRDLLEIYRKTLGLGCRRDELVDTCEISARAVSALSQHLAPAVRSELRGSVAGAAVTALAYYSRSEGADVSVAIDAGLLELTGVRRFVEGRFGSRRVRVLQGDAFDAGLRGIDLMALAHQNARFVEVLARQLERPEW